MKKGDIVYVHDNRYGMSKAQIIKCNGNYYTIRLINNKCGYGVPAHRLILETDYKTVYGNHELVRASAPYLH